MLILIYGVTGMCGQAIAKAALDAGHQVRGLARNPGKLTEELFSRLEGFVKMESIYDIPALDRAVVGVDAVVSAAAPLPETILEGQLLLLRAAERAGIKIFHGASWNFDWRTIPLTEIEIYDPLISFWNHARLSSEINVIFGFTGVIIESFTHRPVSSPFNKEAKVFTFVGNGDVAVNFITTADLAAYTLEAITAPNAADGDVYHVESFKASFIDLGQTYEKVRGVKLEYVSVGSLEEIEILLEDARESLPKREFLDYNGMAFAKYMLAGKLGFEAVDCERWSHIKRTTLEEWYEKHPEI